MDETITEIVAQWRQRIAWHRAEKSLTLQARAMCRSLAMGDKALADDMYEAALAGEDEIALAAISPLIDARNQIEPKRKAVEKRLVKLAGKLPVGGWVQNEVRGMGLLSLAGIIGETGDLSNYANPAKVWKRLGLAVMPDGTRQRRVTGDEAVLHGYVAQRRSLVWNLGNSVIKAGGTYRDLYDERKAYEVARAEANGLTVRPAAQITAKNKAESMSAGHVHNRAKRYVEKRILKELWSEWRRAAQGVSTPVDLPAAIAA